MKSISKMSFEELIEEYRRCGAIYAQVDYGDVLTVARSNRAVTKLLNIAEIIGRDHQDRIYDFSQLLDDEMDQIKVLTAHCILEQMKSPSELESKAIAVIVEISKKDTMAGFECRLWVEQREGKMRSDDCSQVAKPENLDVADEESLTGTFPTNENDLKQIEKACALCLTYANEMCSGGHCGWFDVYPEVDANELIEALRLIGADAFADNFIEAKINGEKDDYVDTDTKFYNLKPPLEDIAEEFISRYIPL